MGTVRIYMRRQISRTIESPLSHGFIGIGFYWKHSRGTYKLPKQMSAQWIRYRLCLERLFSL